MPTEQSARSDRTQWLESTVNGLGDGWTVLRAVREGDAIVDYLVIDANELVRTRWAPVVGDVVGKRLSELPGVRDNRALLDAYGAALLAQNRKVIDFEIPLAGAVGGWRRATAIPFDADTLAVIAADIDRERYFEDAVEEQRTLLSTLASGSRSAAFGTGPSNEARFMKRSAAALFVAAGCVTVINSLVSQPAGVDIRVLRIAAVISMAMGAAVLFVRSEQHPKRIAQGIVLVALALLGISDHLDHYAHAQAALVVYPVFFIMTVAWSGLHLGRGAATATALLSAPVLTWMFASGGQTLSGVQCAVVVLPAAALLGEVLSWSAQRAANLIQLEASRRLHDPLTGLANRTLLIDRLDRSLARSRRNGVPLALLFVDLDRFKQVNDSLGHAAGDELLVEAARRLQTLMREADTVARLGGDEFVMVCEGATAEGASLVADRIIAALHEPVRCARGEAHVGASVGIVHTYDGAETSESMLQKADIAMYRAKARGRGCHELFDAEMQHWVTTRMELGTALRGAMANDELRLEYQPVVDTTDGAIAAVEALLRWDRPGFGVVSPAEFIPYAEESDLIVEIGGWVLREACRQAAHWSHEWPGRRIEIAVNVSSRQIAKGALARQVEDALAASGLDPTLLTLELTESTLIDDAIGASSVLATLRERGVRIAVDDFGTGYSSLTYLRLFPIDVIKIDRTFVETIARSRSDTAIVAAVLALATNLGLDVVAEGVETHEQLAALVYLNCRFAQGFLFSRPVAAAAVPPLVEGPPLGMAATPSPSH